MNSTALGAIVEKEGNIIFISNAHEKFFYEKLKVVRYQDVYKRLCFIRRFELMLKIRLMGTKNDIKWFEKILQRDPKVEVTEFSNLYPNKGTKKFYRAYVEVKKSNRKEL